MAEFRMSGDLAELDRFCKRPKSHTVASPHPASYSEFQATTLDQLHQTPRRPSVSQYGGYVSGRRPKRPLFQIT